MGEGFERDRWPESPGFDDLKVGDAMFTDRWTDEKHSLYLNSIEASFVDQLYSSKYHSEHLSGWPSRTTKDMDSTSFKVLRNGCWEKHNFERAGGGHKNVETEACSLAASPWIQRFKASSSGKELQVIEGNQMHDNGPATQSIHLANQSNTDTANFACYTHLCQRDSISCCTEVSDQNFIDQDSEGGQELGSSYRKKKAKTTAANELFSDQVVPFGNLHLQLRCDDDHTCLRGRDTKGSSRTRKSKTASGLLQAKENSSYQFQGS